MFGGLSGKTISTLQIFNAPIEYPYFTQVVPGVHFTLDLYCERHVDELRNATVHKTTFQTSTHLYEVWATVISMFDSSNSDGKRATTMTKAHAQVW